MFTQREREAEVESTIDAELKRGREAWERGHHDAASRVVDRCMEILDRHDLSKSARQRMTRRVQRLVSKLERFERGQE